MYVNARVYGSEGNTPELLAAIRDVGMEPNVPGFGEDHKPIWIATFNTDDITEKDVELCAKMNKSIQRIEYINNPHSVEV